jgi:endonuclease/exonuclease/phosphatase family metal-dependent hydrolase
MTKFRVACFNVENLFSRPLLFAAGDDPKAADALRGAAVLQRLLDAKTYNTAEIVKTWNEFGLARYVSLRSDRVHAPDARSQRFFFHERDGDDSSAAVSVNAAIRGRADWLGGIDLRGETLSGPQVQAIAKVIRRVDADVIGLCEVEDRRTLETFNAQHLGRKYPYCVLFEGNDERGIDVALMSKHPVGAMRSNAYTVDALEAKRRDGVSPRLFNRDCIEVTVTLPGGKGDLHVMVAHLKSKRGTAGAELDTDRKRIRQSEEIARIVRERYTRDGRPHRVVVCGDFNEVPDRNGANGAALGGRQTSIDALLVESGLIDIVRDTLGPDKSFTHVEERGGRIARGQIDYLLLSPDLKAATIAAGLDRSGQAHWGPRAPPRAQAASDHACLFADIDLARLV